VDENLNLLIGQSATGAFEEGGHQRAGNALGHDTPQHIITRNGEVSWIVQRQGPVALAILTVATGTILAKEHVKVADLPGLEFNISSGWFSRQAITAQEEEQTH